jgi:hypothetical protein
MAINIPIITEFADAGLKSARGAFDNFKTKVAEAEGGMGKFKAGANAAMDSVKANAGVFAAAAGVAIAKFAVDAINDFKDLALSVDDFRNKTNLTLLQSSQWMSYSGDLGIAADSITKIFSRLAKAATDQIPTFKELGVEIAFGPDGATDIERTFFRVNDAINSLDDPVKQAAYRADLFGRGWMDAAEILQMSSSDIQKALQGVKDFEVIDEEEIQKAKDLRAAQDELSDAVARISVTLGEALIPAFVQATEAAKPFLEIITPIVTALGEGADANASYAEQVSKNNVQMRTGIAIADKFFSWLGIGKDKTEELTVATIDVYAAWKNGTRQFIIAQTELEKTQKELENTGDEVKNLDDAVFDLTDTFKDFLAEIDEKEAWEGLQEQLQMVKDKSFEAFVEGTAESAKEAQDETNELIRDIAKYIDELGYIPPDVQTEIVALLQREKFDEALGLIEELRQGVVVPITGTVSGMPVARPGAGGINEIGSGGRPIGETPENTVSLPGIGNVRIPRPTMGAYSAGVTVNVAGSVISENDLVETVRKGLVNSQRNGAGLVYSNR